MITCTAILSNEHLIDVLNIWSILSEIMSTGTYKNFNYIHCRIDDYIKSPRFSYLISQLTLQQ